jgi:hypothetical protein
MIIGDGRDIGYVRFTGVTAPPGGPGGPASAPAPGNGPGNGGPSCGGPKGEICPPAGGGKDG